MLSLICVQLLGILVHVVVTRMISVRSCHQASYSRVSEIEITEIIARKVIGLVKFLIAIERNNFVFLVNVCRCY
jgi:hypothetical protein